MGVVPRITRLRETALDIIHRAGGGLFHDLMRPPEPGNRKEASSLLERGRKHYNRKNFEKAEDYFHRALLVDETYIRAHYFLGLALYKRDDAEGALRLWKRAVELNSADPFAMKANRKIQYVEGHLNRAINELKGRIRKR